MRKGIGALRGGVLMAALSGAVGCGHSMIGTGAEVAASGMREGTASTAQGTNPSAGAAVAVGAGVALMVAGYNLLPPDQRPSAPPAAGFYPRPANAPNAPPALQRQLP